MDGGEKPAASLHGVGTAELHEINHSTGECVDVEWMSFSDPEPAMDPKMVDAAKRDEPANEGVSGCHQEVYGEGLRWQDDQCQVGRDEQGLVPASGARVSYLRQPWRVLPELVV